ncbi:AbrB family transcriptional regulator [Herminiimonas sp. CN]|uniref:AbrB family transcriptional regulator n=1 Tax=Herminiimonas sp. CN TaxID=1349818 RepID=UPI0004736820|nr:AbrB family transcriptional regulator [Herminiimonas sp. CN]
MPFYFPPATTALLRALLIAVSAASLCVWLHTPLPWMIGPIVATAAARMAGIELRAPVQVREAGQWAIGTALGLYFTPAVLHVLSSYVGTIAVGVAFALLLGAGAGWLLHRLTGVDRTTTFFAMATGGASEMAVQGERHGGLVDRIAAAHSLRIMMVVVIIPFGFKFAGVHGIDPFVQGARVVDVPGLLALIGLTCCGALLLRRLNWPNAWVIGPLLVAIALTANSVNLSALPQWIINCGQLFIGVSLGTRFTPAFLHTAPCYLAGVALSAFSAILVAAGFGLLLGAWSGIHPATAILATSPGGIAEMSLTAKHLQLGVPIVTAFHVTRMATLVLSIGPLFRLLQRWTSSRRIGA